MAAKITLKSTSLHMYTTGSQATVRYEVQLDPEDYGIKDNNSTPDIDESSMYDVYNDDDVPDFGSYGIFPAISTNPKGPAINAQGAGKVSSPTEQRLRVEEFHMVPTDNALIQWLDVIYRSRPMPSIDFDSSLTQQQTQNYLASTSTSAIDQTNLTRKQMKLSYTAKQNSYFPGFPSDDQLLPTVPVSAAKLQFGQSVRVSSTWYDDEVGEVILGDIMSFYTQSVSSQDLFYVGDARMWLCTNISWSSNDGGWKRRVTGEFVFNMDGWDTVAVYTDPFTKQLVTLPDDTVKSLLKPLATQNGVPDAYAPDNKGAGRFPQNQATNLRDLYLFLRQSSSLNPNDPTSALLVT